MKCLGWGGLELGGDCWEIFEFDSSSLNLSDFYYLIRFCVLNFLSFEDSFIVVILMYIF